MMDKNSKMFTLILCSLGSVQRGNLHFVVLYRGDPVIEFAERVNSSSDDTESVS